MEFGTGALKVTPAHDFSDYELGQRHGLALINVLNKDASMNVNAGKYAGMDRYACREQLWADMEAAGLTIRAEPYNDAHSAQPARRRSCGTDDEHTMVRADTTAGGKEPWMP